MFYLNAIIYLIQDISNLNTTNNIWHFIFVNNEDSKYLHDSVNFTLKGGN